MCVDFFFCLFIVPPLLPAGCMSDLQRRLPAGFCGGWDHLLCGPGQEPSGALQSADHLRRVQWSTLHHGERGSSWLTEKQQLIGRVALQRLWRSRLTGWPVSKKSWDSVLVQWAGEKMENLSRVTAFSCVCVRARVCMCVCTHVWACLQPSRVLSYNVNMKFKKVNIIRKPMAAAHIGTTLSVGAADTEQMSPVFIWIWSSNTSKPSK